MGNNILSVKMPNDKSVKTNIELIEMMVYRVKSFVEMSFFMENKIRYILDDMMAYINIDKLL
jgi:hypothetical protein